MRILEARKKIQAGVELGQVKLKVIVEVEGGVEVDIEVEDRVKERVHSEMKISLV